MRTNGAFAPGLMLNAANIPSGKRPGAYPPRTMSESTSYLRFRALEPADLDTIFGPVARQHGAAWLERQTAGEVYVAFAFLDGTPVARCGLDFVSHAHEGAAHLWAAHVEPGYQGQGIGTAMFAHLEQVALAHGFAAIRLEVGKDNPRARALYLRLGYAPCGEETGRWSYRDEQGATVEVVEECDVLRKRLSPASA